MWLTPMHSAPDLQPTTDHNDVMPASDGGEPLSLVRERLSRLFKFLKAYSDLRYPPVREIDQQPGVIWLEQLPADPAVELFRKPQEPDEFTGDDDIVLRLQRPTSTPCPEPPAIVSEWLIPGWQESTGPAEAQSSRPLNHPTGTPTVEHFQADPQRPAALRQWQEKRSQWQTREQAARQALALFETAYAWFGAQEREGERIELLLGDGLLICPGEKGRFRHPVLLQKLRFS